MQESFALKNMAWTVDAETWEAIAIAFKEVDPPAGRRIFVSHTSN